jgi:CheY-like chemotaxis protein/anti-sigma regulatory factor (Ser/Thr protein kinase)
MIGFAQLLGLDREPGLTSHQMEWTQQIQRAGWHLLEMINETLDLARIESGAVRLSSEPVALPALVHGARALVSALAEQRDIDIEESLSPEAPAVLGDATRLKQVLTNLLSNAVKYNVEHGRVWVSARPGSDGGVVIAVTDSGLGMTPEQLSSLFQPYNRLGRETSDIEGTGIGLVISRRLVELMGGTLEARSVAGKGSTFTLRLPAADAADTPDAPREAVFNAPYQQRRVHYVEDNPTNVEVMRGVLLQRPQVQLDVSVNGLDGLESIRSNRPDLVLLDMHLPDVSGLELLRHLKADPDLAEIPVIVVSADATAARMAEALTMGALHYITKPVDVPRFLEVLDDTLESLETRWG